MDFGDILQGAGLFVCIGGLLLAVLAFVAIRRAFSSRNQPQIDRDNDRLARSQPVERPRYDSDRVESSGGFGSAPSSTTRGRDLDDLVPNTGRRRESLNDDRLERDLDDEDALQRYRRNRGQAQDDDRDDEVRSRGGFGS